ARCAECLRAFQTWEGIGDFEAARLILDVLENHLFSLAPLNVLLRFDQPEQLAAAQSFEERVWIVRNAIKSLRASGAINPQQLKFLFEMLAHPPVDHEALYQSCCHFFFGDS